MTVSFAREERETNSEPPPLGTPESRAFGSSRVSGSQDEWGGWASATAHILGPLLPAEEDFRHLCHSLLEHRDHALESAARSEALSVLWSLVLSAARFGALDESEIAEGFSPFLIPPVPSERLLAYSLITAPEEIWQLRMRRIGRAERGKGPPENRVLVKAASRQDMVEFGLQGLLVERPILLVEERYTVALPQIRNAELDRIRSHALYREAGRPQVLFLGETQKPHAHFTLASNGAAERQKWYRVDTVTHPDFEIPLRALPQVISTHKPKVASNEQVADLMVLLVEGTRQATER